MTEYRVARPGEENKLLDLANMVFSMAHEPHDFRRLCPKVYARDDFASLHVVAAQGDQQRAMVGTYVFDLKVGQRLLRVGYIGTVSAHPDDKGLGHMRKLVPMAIDRAREQGIHLLALGGQRQRYNYFGFETGSVSASFDVNDVNLRHLLRDVPQERTLRFVPFDDAPDAVAQEALQHAQKQPMAGIRDMALMQQSMKMWKGAGHILLKTDAYAGYVYALHAHWHEWALLNPGDLLPALLAWQDATSTQRTGLTVPLYADEEIGILTRAAEGFSLQNKHMLNVLDWGTVLDTLMAFLAGQGGAEEGDLVVEVEGAGRFRLSVRDGIGTAAVTDQSAQTTLSPNEAVLQLFSLAAMMDNNKTAGPRWFPLPLFISTADAF